MKPKLQSARERLGLADRLSAALSKRIGQKDELKVYGHVTVELFGADGRLKSVRQQKNLVVTTGRDAIIERLDSSPATTQPTHMAVGTGAVAPAAGNTALGAEIDRNALTSNTASGGVLTMVGNWAAGEATNAAITEAGVFNASSAGTMYSRATFTAINKGASDTLQITWTYTLTPS
jgi:hypothetical protein